MCRSGLNGDRLTIAEVCSSLSCVSKLFVICQRTILVPLIYMTFVSLPGDLLCPVVLGYLSHWLSLISVLAGCRIPEQEGVRATGNPVHLRAS